VERKRRNKRRREKEGISGGEKEKNKRWRER
jgi:hypothetical protein